MKEKDGNVIGVIEGIVIDGRVNDSDVYGV